MPNACRDMLHNAAALLISEGGENPEYDRGIAELLADTVDAESGIEHGVTTQRVLDGLRARRQQLLRT